MIAIKGLCKSYDNKRVVDNLDLTINDGEIYGFIGHNGAGKTTTIKCLIGILSFEEGEILIDGLSIKDKPIECKRKIAYIPDNPDLYNYMSGVDYLNFIGDVYKVPVEERKFRIENYCQKFGLKEVLNNRISSFSHGMKQKLFLIASLITEPQNWILDEPMVGLDPEAAFIIKETMREHAAAGKTVFFSTHVMEVAEKLCDRIGVIKKGQLIFVGTMQELKEQHGKEGQSLEDIFLSLIGSEVRETSVQ